MGELLVKGPNVMKGYKNNPKANSDVLVDGWLKSGDLAKIDEDGFVTIVDRLKELIKVNKSNLLQTPDNFKAGLKRE